MRLLTRLSLLVTTLLMLYAAVTFAPPNRSAEDRVAVMAAAVQTCALPAVATPDLALVADANLGTAALGQLAHVTPASTIEAAEGPPAILVASLHRNVLDGSANALLSPRWSALEASTSDSAPAVPDGYRKLVRLLTRQS